MADILTPTLGESVSEATVARWTKKAGDAVKKDELLVELETDKVSLEVVASIDGVLGQIDAPEGSTVVAGQKLGALSADGATAAPVSTAPAAAPAKAASAAMIDIAVPTMGESVSEGTLGVWAKKVGDKVSKDDILVEIETDKVALEIAAPADGVIVEVLATDGATVTPGQVLARLSGDANAAVVAPAATPVAAPVAASAGLPLAPSVQRIVAENNLNSSAIPGTGRDGRITKGDALAAIGTQTAPAPAAAYAPAPAPVVAAPRADQPREERVRMTRLRQTIARRLKDAQNTAAMLTTFNEVDMSTVMALRNQYKDAFEKRHGVKLGFMGFFVKACIAALKEVPAVNAEIDGQDLIYKNHYDIGVAVGTEKGLVVPVVRDADQLTLAGVEKAIGGLGRQARDGALSMDQLTGGTFTISNGGVYGSLMSTPILNAPQSGILGMHKIQDRPVVVGGQIVIRPMMYLALSYDHRVIDGKEAVTFLVSVKDHIEDPQRLILDL